MSNQRVEIQHNEPDQIRGWLDEAQAMMDERNLLASEHPALLVKLLELLSSKTIQEVRFMPPDLIAAPAGSIPGGGPRH